jgi:phenylpropionate dioxygenase-like ring-hydroxylating dioxygenase large terminal subunit
METPVLDLPRRCTFAPEDWAVLADFWHPVCFSDQVSATKPTTAILLDEEMVLYRAGGAVVAARNLCLHRGVPLSLGWIEGEEIVCAYHGFRYGAGGKCTFVPAQSRLPVPGKLCLKNYLSAERYGVVWVCLSGKPRQPLPEWPELEDPKLKQIQMGPEVWQCSAPRHVENFNDLAHLSWVHVGTFGNRSSTEIEKYEVETRPHGIHFEMLYDRYSLEQPGGPQKLERVHYTYDLTYPFYTRLRIAFPDGRNFVIFNLPSPISARQSNIMFRMTRDFDVDGPAEPTLELQRRVLAEDRVLVEAQRPEELPLDLSEEFHIRADRFSTVYRQALRQMGLGRNFTS